MTNMNKYYAKYLHNFIYAQDLAVATAARLNCLALFQLSLTRNLIQGANLDQERKENTFIDFLLEERRKVRRLIYSGKQDTHTLTTPQAQCAMAIYGLQ